MRFLIINTDYPEFLQWFYQEYPGLEKKTYDEQLKIRNETLFGTADFYSSNLQKLGHEAWDIHANNLFMQKAWANEHIPKSKFEVIQEELHGFLKYFRKLAAKAPLSYIKYIFHHILKPQYRNWFYEILKAQIKYYKPDVILNMSMSTISCEFLKEVKPYVRLLVGQHAATPLSDSEDWAQYDLVISSFPPVIQFFQNKGIPTRLIRLAFEPKVLSFIDTSVNNEFEVTFVGSFHYVHRSRIEWLETLCKYGLEIKIWGSGIENLPNDSKIKNHYMGQAWGRKMFQIISKSKITLNHHGSIPPYANNMRLFEATGVGTLLITDWKINLHEMFEIGKEAVAYHTPEECAELIRYYLEHDEERKAIAQAGQNRTLREHTYYQRMQELTETIKKYL